MKGKWITSLMAVHRQVNARIHLALSCSIHILNNEDVPESMEKFAIAAALLLLASNPWISGPGLHQVHSCSCAFSLLQRPSL